MTNYPRRLWRWMSARIDARTIVRSTSLIGLLVLFVVVSVWGCGAIDHRFFADATTRATDEVLDRVDDVRATVDRVLRDSSSTEDARSAVIDAIESWDAHVYGSAILDERHVEFDVVVAEQANGSIVTNTSATIRGCVRLSGRVGDDPSVHQDDQHCPNPIPGDRAHQYSGREIVVSTGTFYPLTTGQGRPARPDTMPAGWAGTVRAAG